jgi:hypothetical protein
MTPLEAIRKGGSQKKKRKFRNRSFAMLEADLIESDAFRDLSGKWAVVVLIRFHQKAHRKNPSRRQQALHRYIITNNGEIVFTYGEAKELGIKSDRTYHKVIRELVEDKGFIDIAEFGNWYQQKPTKFAISSRWKRYGTPDYKPEKIPRLLPQGLGFQKGKEK